MRPDEHKRKRSAQYKKSRGIADNKGKANTQLQDPKHLVKDKRDLQPQTVNQSQRERERSYHDKSKGFGIHHECQSPASNERDSDEQVR